MATLTMVKYYVEGADLISELQTDVKDIQGSNVLDGWQDLSYGITHEESEFSDILNSKYSQAQQTITNTTNDAEAYLKSISLQVQRPNWDGNPNDQYINLYEGSVTWNGDGTFTDNPSQEDQ